MEKIKLLIADDHALIRSGITLLLAEHEDIEIMAEGEKGTEVVALVDEHNPDVLLMDIEMPELNGLQAAKEILSKRPELGIILLTMYSDEHYLRRSIELGCKGYLLKQSDTHEIVQAIRTVASGDVYFGSGVSRNFLRLSATRSGLNPNLERTRLSKRELEVLCLIAEGQSSKEIADNLFISVRTVDTHRSNILHKLKMSNTAQLVRYAIKNKLVDLL